MTTSMKTFVMLFILIIAFISNSVHSLPPINFTDTVLTNRMIEALSDALGTRDGQQITPFRQLRQRPRQQAPYPQQLPEQQQQASYPQQLPEQQQVYYQKQVPELPHSFYQQQFIDQHQQQEQQFQQTKQDQQYQQPNQQQQFQQPNQQQQFQQPNQQQQFQQPNQQQQQFQQPNQQQNFLEQKFQQPIQQQQLPEQKFQQPIQQQQLPEQQQQSSITDSRGFYYPYPFQNLNWYNFPFLWPGVAGGQLDPTAPLAGVGAQLTGLGTTAGCPAGLCPNGATCSQDAGQWQCGCSINGCPGIANPCGLYGQYYFPYYPDASRFIQCDQTGVFWIRKCAPGTIFDPKIGVCNYPPVVVETGKK